MRSNTTPKFCQVAPWQAPARSPRGQATRRAYAGLSHPAVGAQVTVEEARRRIEDIKEPYKMEILEGILARDPASTITIWHIGEQGQKDHWWDLCAGPHVPTTGHIAPDAIDLETVAGAFEM